MPTKLRYFLLFLAILFLLAMPVLADINVTQVFNNNTGLGQTQASDYVIVNRTFIIDQSNLAPESEFIVQEILGIILLLASNVLPSRRGALVAGFASSMFLLYAAWGSVGLDTVTSNGITSTLLPTGQLKTVIMEVHTVYSLPWLGMILGLLFFWSVITNLLIVADLRSIRPKPVPSLPGFMDAGNKEILTEGEGDEVPYNDV